jgi:hypothetical protein
MAGPAFNKFNAFALDLGNKVHNLSTDSLKVMLSDVAPVATNAVKADITEIAAGNGYTTGGLVAAFVSWSQVSGLATLNLTAPTWTAGPAAMAQFRYLVLYNSTPVAGNLIGWWDWGSEIILPNGGIFAPTYDAVNGVLTLQ